MSNYYYQIELTLTLRPDIIPSVMKNVQRNVAFRNWNLIIYGSILFMEFAGGAEGGGEGRQRSSEWNHISQCF